jgi:hypothetical protein
MRAWNDDELRRVSGAQELEIAPVRSNGELRRRTPIWVVRAGDDLFVRAAYGAGSAWHRLARASHQARSWAGGLEKNVTVEDVDGPVLGAVDAAYQEKHGCRYASIVDTINDPEHRVSTLRLLPREDQR